MNSNFRNVMVITAIAMLTLGAAGCKRADNSGGSGTDAGSTGAMSAPPAASGGAAAGGMSGGASGASQ